MSPRFPAYRSCCNFATVSVTTQCLLMEGFVLHPGAIPIRTLGLLWQMHDAASFVIEWTKDASGEFTGDRTLTRAIERKVGVVGEAARQLLARDPETARGI